MLERQGVRKSELCALLYANELPASELPDECTDERDLFFALDPPELGSRLVRRLLAEAVATTPADAADADADADADGVTAADAVAATASPAATGTADAPESAVVPVVTPVAIAAATSIELFHTTWEAHSLDGQPLDAAASQSWGNPALVTLWGSRVAGLSVSSEMPPVAPEADADGECDDADDALGEDSQLAFAAARPSLLSNILYTEGLPVWQPDTKREF